MDGGIKCQGRVRGSCSESRAASWRDFFFLEDEQKDCKGQLEDDGEKDLFIIKTLML